MKTFLATLAGVALAAHDSNYHHVSYEDVADYEVHVPTGDFYDQVDDFNPWVEIRD